MSTKKIPKDSKIRTKRPSASRMVEDVLGSKWLIAVLQLVSQGICTPGAIERSVDGLTTKVLNEQLNKLVDYKILERLAFPEIPPHVEYRLTPFGKKFVNILQAIEELDTEMERDHP